MSVGLSSKTESSSTTIRSSTLLDYPQARALALALAGGVLARTRLVGRGGLGRCRCLLDIGTRTVVSLVIRSTQVGCFALV